MQDNDRREFVTAISAMAATFRQEATEALFEGYWLGLRDLEIRSAKLAVTRAIRECRFMPSVAELRDLAGQLSPADRAIKAWDATRRAISTDGYYHSVDFDDRVINATIRSMGGWMRFAERFDEDEEKWIRKDFERIYISFARSGISEEASMPLVGFFDQDNQGRGYLDAVKGPKLIETGLPAHDPGIVPALTSPTREPMRRLEHLTAGIGKMPALTE